MSIPKPFFAWGLGAGVFFPLASGASTIVSSGRTDVKETAELIRVYRPTIFCAIPSFLALLLQARDWLDLDFSSLRYIASAGEPLSRHVFDVLRNDYNLEVVEGIGSTEMLTHFISNAPGRSYPGTCGIEVPGCEVALVDDEGRRVTAGKIGGLMVKGPTSFLGYWRNAEATTRVRNGEWLVTGDNLYQDEDGYYHYCGRNDDMLKLAGVWIIPQDVEDALCRHHNVLEAIVTTRPDNAGRRRLVAYVVTRPGMTPTALELLRFLQSEVSLNAIPTAFVVLPSIPRTPNGKLDRTSLPTPDW